jgi:hypothetical protein
VLEISGLESLRAAVDGTCETAFCTGPPSRRASPEPAVRANSQAEALRPQLGLGRGIGMHVGYEQGPPAAAGPAEIVIFGAPQRRDWRKSLAHNSFSGRACGAIRHSFD